MLEGLAATGLRALRYALEIEGVDSVHAVDLDPSAVAAMRRNVALNCGAAAEGGSSGAPAGARGEDPPPLPSQRARRVRPSQGDARLVMLANANCYDVVDLDPYGSPATLLDAAVRAVSHGGKGISFLIFLKKRKKESFGNPNNCFILNSPPQKKLLSSGLLCVTATDMAVLCGANPGSCYSKYASMPLHKPYGHEQGLRILLAAVETAAARAGRTIEPLLSASIDFYARVFVRVRAAPGAAKSLPLRLAHVYQSVGCDSFHLQRVGRDASKPNRHGARDPNNAKVVAAVAPAVPAVECPHTGARWAMGGPLWAGKLHDLEWVRAVAAEVATVSREAKRSAEAAAAAAAGGAAAGGAAPPAFSPAASLPVVPVYQAAPRVLALLTAVAEELPDAPLYYSMHSLSRTLRCTPPPAEALRSAVLNAGFRVSGSHACPLALKTDAPPAVVWDIMRCWVAEHCGGRGGAASAKKQQLKGKGGGGGEDGGGAPPLSSAERILSVEPELKASFARAQGAARPNGSGLMLPGEAGAAAGAPGAGAGGGGGAAAALPQKRKAARFLPNPEPHWGPKARAGKGRKAVAQAEKNEALAAAKESVASEARERARGAEEAVAKRAERAARAAAAAAATGAKELALA